MAIDKPLEKVPDFLHKEAAIVETPIEKAPEKKEVSGKYITNATWSETDQTVTVTYSDGESEISKPVSLDVYREFEKSFEQKDAKDDAWKYESLKAFKALNK